MKDLVKEVSLSPTVLSAIISAGVKILVTGGLGKIGIIMRKIIYHVI